MGGAPHRNARSWVALIVGAIALGTGLAWMLAAIMGEAATQRVPNTNGSKMVPLAVSIDV